MLLVVVVLTVLSHSPPRQLPVDAIRFGCPLLGAGNRCRMADYQKSSEDLVAVAVPVLQSVVLQSSWMIRADAEHVA